MEKPKEKDIDDQVDLHHCFARVKYDDDLKKVVIEYVDPQDLVVQYSKYHNYKDSEYWGIYKLWKISKIKQKMPELKDDELIEIAKQYEGHYENSLDANNKYTDKYKSDIDLYYDWSIPVMECEWMDIEEDTKIESYEGYGKKRYKEYKGKKPKENQKLKTTRIRKLYQCSWIIGTEHIFDYGVVHNQPRPIPSRPALSLVGVSLPGYSMMARLIPVFDNIQIGWQKFQNSLSVIFEEGWALNMDMLMNLSDGKKQYSFEDIIEFWRNTGILLFKRKISGLTATRGDTSLPVEKLPGGMGQRLVESINMFAHQMKLIEDITGLSPVSLGGTPESDAPVTTTERSLQATHNILKPLINAVFEVKEKAAEIAGLKIQLLLRNDSTVRKAYEKVIGEQAVQMLIDGEKGSVEYGIKLVARPTEKDKASLLEAARTSLMQGRDGKPGIDLATYTYIDEQLTNGGNIKELRRYLAYMDKKEKERDYMESMKKIEFEKQRDQENLKLKGQQEAIKQKRETDSKILIDDNESKNRMKEEQFKKNLEFMTSLELEKLESQKVLENETNT